jgi:hypothetical protein
MSGYKLLLPLVFGDSSPTKDGGNGLSEVLVGVPFSCLVLRLDRLWSHHRHAMAYLMIRHRVLSLGLCTLTWCAWHPCG